MIAFPTNVFDPHYMDVLNLYHKQQNQDNDNQKKHDDFLINYNSWVAINTVKRDSHQPLDSPLIPPKKVTWDDNNKMIETDFTDLKPANEAALVPATAAPDPNTLFGHVAPALSVQDMLNAILMTLQELLRRVPASR